MLVVNPVTWVPAIAGTVRPLINKLNLNVARVQVEPLHAA